MSLHGQGRGCTVLRLFSLFAYNTPEQEAVIARRRFQTEVRGYGGFVTCAEALPAASLITAVLPLVLQVVSDSFNMELCRFTSRNSCIFRLFGNLE